MSPFPYIPDHVERALDDLVTAYRDKPRIRALITALAEGAQAFEDECLNMLLARTLSASSGALLDLWGALVGEARQGLEDAEYRRFIQARLLVNRSQGTVPELVRIFAIISAPSTIQYHDHFPAGFRLTAYRDAPLEDALRARIRRMMRTIKPGGVGMTLTEASSDSIQFGELGRGLGATFSRVI